ncbi:tRNA nucleotidyltransferase [Faecalibacterium langellae]|uniref:tRNA nucleotidyltransferase n=1 Tax=Faecalibacterium langellae TaxID=3435293 RepID=A0A2A6ZDH8_9FIRM|nr:tRNA nucleotidyltransferase [Faecalibacterium prausnitzii]PDX59427.1 tRNA nucleotidyltransferase [Faecalibacterium prausnitzii]
MTIRMDEGAAELLDTLHRAGYAAYVVGGCVRDSLLGLTPHDWDLCTSALPQQVTELFGAQRCIPTGLQHGTVTVKQSGALYEITTFRTEGTYTDGRHPDEVHFVPDVREDLARRDLTINAMAYNEKEGLVDPFGGQADLQSGIVRAVGVPRQRFTEDALRILRLYRFAARFGFAIDPPTAQAAQELCAHLDCVSVERIEEELAKLLSAPAPAAYLNEKILGVVLPELSSEALAAAKPVVDACPAGAENLPIRLAALLLSLGEDGIRRTLKRLRCSNALIEEAAVLVREARGCDGSFLFGHDSGHSIARPIAFGNRVPPQRTVLRETTVTPGFTIYARRLLGRYNLCTVQRIAALGTALQPERAADFAALSELAEQLDADGVCCRVSQLAVNGRDLMAAGVPAGPGIRKILEALLDGVIREEYPNERQALLAAVQQLAAS